MSNHYKVALGLDADYYDKVAAEIKTVADLYPIDFSHSIETPDNNYICIFWDDIPWDITEAISLREKLRRIRHSIITIDEEGFVEKDIKVQDNYGIDEEFYELLTINYSISFYGKEISNG